MGSEASSFGPSEKQWMITFRVDDIDATLTQLADAGIDAQLAGETSTNGRFARLHDSEGEQIELWEPA